ncbi:MAG: DUF2970 domain-containing protein [Cellvibrionaceae bacterium]
MTHKDPIKQEQEENSLSNNTREKPPLLSVMGSVLAAAFGVQSSKNRERDFSGGGLWSYVLVGVLFTVIFVLTVVFLVKAILKNAGVS